MEARQKPTVMIRTYSSYSPIMSSDQSSSLPQNNHQLHLKHQHQKHHQHQHQHQSLDTTTATKSDRSTELFIKSNQNNRSQTHKPNRILRYLNQIKGPNGSVRGHRDVVKKSLENIQVATGGGGHNRNFNSSSIFTTIRSVCSTTRSQNLTTKQLDNFYRSDYLTKLIEEEQNQCVAYTTSLGVIRRTFEDSKLMKSILNLNLIRYEERDIYLNQEYKLQLRMRCNSITVPALFVGGQHFGGIKELELMNENGKLPILLANYKMTKAPRGICLCCGNARFIACQTCNGSRKSTIHHFKFNSIALRCIKCDKNDGLVQCPICHLASDIDDDDDDYDNYVDRMRSVGMATGCSAVLGARDGTKDVNNNTNNNR